MRLIDETVVIQAPPASVYAYVANHEHYQRWYPGVQAVAALDDMPHGSPGKVYRETLEIAPGRTADMTIRVVLAAPDSRFVTESELGRWLTRMDIEFSPAGTGGTRLTWRFHLRNKPLLPNLLFRLSAAPAMKRRTRAGLARLKSILELG
ncbi:MAG: SRPBCC family protein [Caulobacter sp.]|nr:SRPBCC family protein [Caulobacter sp.]